jgi:hypothetical protein
MLKYENHYNSGSADHNLQIDLKELLEITDSWVSFPEIVKKLL